MDFLGRNLCTGTIVYAAFNDGKYIVLESSAVDEETCECVCTTTETTTTETTPPCDGGLGEYIPGGAREGVLGFDSNGCLTIYETTDCETPTTE